MKRFYVIGTWFYEPDADLIRINFAGKSEIGDFWTSDPDKAVTFIEEEDAVFTMLKLAPNSTYTVMKIYKKV